MKAQAGISIAAFVLFGLAAAWPAMAENCKPVSVIATIDMSMDYAGRPTIPMRFGNTQKQMLVDTGNVFSELDDNTVRELGFTDRPSPVRLIDATGKLSTRVAHATQFNIGNLHSDGGDFIITRSNGASGIAGMGLSGIVGPNLLSAYDIEMNFETGKLNFISADHCAGKAVYWPAEAITAIPMRLVSSGHIVIPVTLDGQKMDALIDTGASTTLMNLRVAEATFRLTTSPSDMEPMGTFNGDPNAVLYSHRFKSLKLDTTEIKDPIVTIAPDLMRSVMTNSGTPTGTMVAKKDDTKGLPDITIGMDVLRAFHIYIAYPEQRLYLTPGGPPMPIPAAPGGMESQSVPTSTAEKPD